MRITVLLVICLCANGCSRSNTPDVSASAPDASQKTIASSASSKEPSSKDLSAVFRDIQIDYQQKTRQINSRLRAAESSEQHEKIMSDAPDQLESVQAAINLFTAHESNDAYIDMAIWVLRTTDDESAISQVLDNVKVNHLENAKIVSFLQVAISQRIPLATEFVTSLAEQGDSPASMVARLATISTLNPDTDQQRIIQMLESVENYDREIVFAGTDFRAMAAGQLFSLTQLQIGAEAPDIEGEDVEGVSFKLSDYRGNVVMLDFWGNW